MENKFKPFDKILVRDHEEVWQPDFYGFWDKCRDRHQTMMNNSIADDDILPYKGNEYLVGTTNEPYEVVGVKEGECCIFFDDLECIEKIKDLFIDKFKLIDKTENAFLSGGEPSLWKFCICFSDFNLNDMEETKKHILVVKNGKVIKYKNN